MFLRLSILLSVLLYVYYPQQVEAQQFEIDHIDYAYGLSNSQISDIQQDKDGFIWLGTRGGGVYRWDGSILNPFLDTLKYDIITSLAPVNFNSIMIAGNRKLSYIDKNDYSELDINKFLIDDQDYLIKTFTVDGTFILLSAKGLLSVYNAQNDSIRQQFKPLKSSTVRSNLLVNKQDIFLFTGAQYKHLVWREEAKKLSVKSELSLEKPVYPQSVFLEADHFIIIEKGFINFYNYDFKLIKKVKIGFEADVSVATFFEGFYWLGGPTGLYQCLYTEGELRLVKKHLNFSCNQFYQDKGVLWVGSMKGLFQIKKSAIYLLENQNNQINSGYFDFETTSEYIWGASVSNGLHLFENEELIEVIKFKEIAFNYTRCIQPLGEDSLLVATEGGMLSINKLTHEYRLHPKLTPAILSMNTIADEIYIGSASEGVFIYGENGIRQPIWNKALNNAGIYALKAASDKLYVGTENGLTIIHQDSAYQYNQVASMVNKPIVGISSLNDSIVAIGYAPGGVFLLNVQTDELIAKFNTSNGLSSDYIYVLSFIDNDLWVGSSLGVDIISFSDGKGRINQLRKLKKVAGAETFFNSIIQLEDRVWINTIAGTLTIPQDIISNYEAAENYPIIIENIASLTTLQEEQTADELIEIPYQHNSVEINYSAADYDNKHPNIQYQLIPYESNHNEATASHQAIYKQLPPGDYTFKIWYQQNGKQLGEVSQSFRITVPYYANKNYQIAALLLVVMVIIFLLWNNGRLKVMRQKEGELIREQAQDELRKDMAIDFHDELGNHLAKIINFSGVVQLQALQPNQLMAVKKIEKSANELFVSTKDLIWSLKKENNNLEEAFFYIKDFADRLFDHTDIQIRFFKTSDFSQIVFNPKASRDLSLILKECLTNVYKHAEANNISLKFGAIDGHATIELKDDGIGYDEQAIKRKNGLRNMEQRARRSGFALHINSEVGQGTTAIITIN